MNIAFTTDATTQDPAIDWARKKYNQSLPAGSTSLTSKQYFEKCCQDLASSIVETHKERAKAAVVKELYKAATPSVQAQVETLLGVPV